MARRPSSTTWALGRLAVAFGFSLILLLASLRPAHARGGTIEIVPQRGLFLLEELQQWVGFNYQFTDHNVTGNSLGYTAHNFQELYHAQGSLSILNPHLLTIAMTGDVGLEQIDNSGTGSTSFGKNALYEYSVNASALDSSWHPVTLFTSHSLDTVVTPFSPTLSSTVDRSGLDLLFINTPLLTRFRYETNTLAVKGGSLDSTAASHYFDASASHNYRGINNASVDFSLNATNTTSISNGKGSDQSGHGYSFDASDTLHLGKTKQYGLTSRVQSQDVTTGGVPQKILTLSEAFSGHLGKALDVQLSYRHSENRTADQNNQELLYKTDFYDGQLRHHLFQNLDTLLVGTVSQTSLPGGSETDTSGVVGLTYQKRIGAENLLKVQGTYQRDVTDRKGAATEHVVVDERQTVELANTAFTLKLTGPVLQGSVRIRSLTAGSTDQNPIFRTYQEDIDYRVDYQLAVVTWGGVVPDNPVLRVSYTSLLDPSVQYATNTLNTSATLSLMNGRCLFTGAYFDQSRELISGSTQNGLFDSRSVLFRFMRIYDTQSFSFEYNDHLAGPSKFRYVEGDWQYNEQGYLKTLQFEANDRYTIYGSSFSSASSNSVQNSLTASATMTREVFDLAQWLLSLNFVDERGGGSPNGDKVFVRSTFKARFNQVTLSLSGSSSWRLTGATRTRDDFFRMELKRYF